MSDLDKSNVILLASGLILIIVIMAVGISAEIRELRQRVEKLENKR